MKTKLMRFITSFFESWREEKKVLANQPESIVEHTDITVVRSTNHPVAERVKTVPVSLTDQVNRFLQSTYDFRYNLLTEETEYRPADGRGEPFAPVGRRELNSFSKRMHGALPVGIKTSVVIFILPVYPVIILSFCIWTNFRPGMALIVLKHWRTVFLLIHCG